MHMPNGIKYFIAFLSIVTIMLLFQLPFTSAQGPCDANDSGTITAADVTALINDLRNRAPAQGNADCNNSGTVTAADVTALINVLRGRTEPPSNGPPPPTPSGCKDFINALCERNGECIEVSNFENCVRFFEVFTDCDTIDILPDVNQCIADLDKFDCVALTENTLLPDTCIPVGACDICESNADCPEGLLCSPCFDGLDDLFGFDDLGDLPDCTGVVDRCAPFSFFFVECEDGFF